MERTRPHTQHTLSLLRIMTRVFLCVVLQDAFVVKLRSENSLIAPAKDVKGVIGKLQGPKIPVWWQTFGSSFRSNRSEASETAGRTAQQPPSESSRRQLRSQLEWRPRERDGPRTGARGRRRDVLPSIQSGSAALDSQRALKPDFGNALSCGVKSGADHLGRRGPASRRHDAHSSF